MTGKRSNFKRVERDFYPTPEAAVLPLLGKVDAVVTDPPYGIGEDGGAKRTRGKKGYAKHKSKSWDKERPQREIFDMMRAISGEQIIWGGNYFADWLPPRMGLLL